MNTQKKGLFSTVAAVVVGAVCFFGAKQLTSGGVSTAQRALTPKAEVEEMIDRKAAGDPFLAAFSQSFPDEWRMMRSQLADDAKSSISASEVERRAHARSRAFMLERTRSTAAAPTPALIAVANAEGELITQLQRENEQYCADFAMRGIQPGSNLSPQAAQLASQAARARVIATRQGIDAPERRVPTSDADWGAAFDAMQRSGMSESMFASFSNPASASAELQCAGGVHLYRSVAALPPEQGARVFADMTIEAAKAAAP